MTDDEPMWREGDRTDAMHGCLIALGVAALTIALAAFIVVALVAFR
jgi:hypothetical protein